MDLETYSIAGTDFLGVRSTKMTSSTKYDLTHTMAPFLDAHLFWDIFNHLENNTNNCYSKETLLNAKLELVKETNMVDMEMELFQQLNSNAAVPSDMQGKKETVDKRCKDLHDQAGKLVDLIEIQWFYYSALLLCIKQTKIIEINHYAINF